MKPGYKTTEFITNGATLVAILIGSIQGALSPENASIVGAVLAGIYTFGRTFVKVYGSRNGG